MIETNAVGPSARIQETVKFFNFREVLSMTFAPPWSWLIISGKRCSVCDQKQVYEQRAWRIVSPSWEATQPPTPIISSGLSCLSVFQRPAGGTFSCFLANWASVNKITSASQHFCSMSLAASNRSDFLRVVLVHLAAPGFDIQLFSHNNYSITC